MIEVSEDMVERAAAGLYAHLRPDATVAWADLNDYEADKIREEASNALEAALSAQPAPHPDDAVVDLSEWLQKEMPPGTIISNPVWWAKRIAARMCTCHANNAAAETTDGKRQWDELAGVIGADGDNVDDVFAKARALVQPAPERQGDPCIECGTEHGTPCPAGCCCAAAPVGVPEPLPMDAAPRDGSMMRLLVRFTEHATDDAEEAWTIGSNSFDANGEDVWQFAGWCWTHDHFTEGKGTPIGWLPMLAAAPSAPQGTQQGEGE